VCTVGINIFKPGAFNVEVQRFMTRANPGRFDPPHWGHGKNPKSYFNGHIRPKIYRFGLSDPDLAMEVIFINI
jgi:hypothetical protein